MRRGQKGAIVGQRGVVLGGVALDEKANKENKIIRSDTDCIMILTSYYLVSLD